MYARAVAPRCAFTYLSSCGRNDDTISISRPTTSTVMVLLEQPFHSLRIMPHTLLNVTLRAINMHQENVSSTAESVRKPLPRLSPKNWLYQRRPARAQNTMLLR